MKTIEVTVVRRTYTTYHVEVADDFDVNARGSYAALESDYFDFGDWEEQYDETANWDIDSVVEL